MKFLSRYRDPLVYAGYLLFLIAISVGVFEKHFNRDGVFLFIIYSLGGTIAGVCIIYAMDTIISQQTDMHKLFQSVKWALSGVAVIAFLFALTLFARGAL